MNLPDRPAIRHAYERAVVAMLNATNATEEEAEAFVDAMADLIFTTMKQYIEEEENDATHNH
jgi:creatinine amidohydrolase/Fe(II)-dependent formamide hydrolase-like protein